MQAKRTKDGSAAYGMGALAHQDLGFDVHVITAPRPRPGDKATLRVALTDRAGNPIEKADVRSDVHQPAPWIGDPLGQRVATDLALLKKLRKSSSKANLDTYHPADRVLRYMHKQGEIAGGTHKNHRLAEKSPGVYEADLTLTEPGTWQLSARHPEVPPTCPREAAQAAAPAPSGPSAS